MVEKHRPQTEARTFKYYKPQKKVLEKDENAVRGILSKTIRYFE